MRLIRQVGLNELQNVALERMNIDDDVKSFVIDYVIIRFFKIFIRVIN